MIHIVFNTADIEVLRQAMELDESIKGEIFEIKDDWGVGPLENLDTDEGWKARQDWWIIAKLEIFIGFIVILQFFIWLS